MAIERVRRNGAFTALSAFYYQDDDIADAGEAAELLFLRGLAFCAQKATDGFISTNQVHRFAAVGLDNIDARAERLAEVGLWEVVDGGYQIRSWLKWNKSAEELGQYRASDRDRKKVKPTSTEGDEKPSARKRETVRAEGNVPSEPLKTSERKPRGIRAENIGAATDENTTTAAQTTLDIPIGIRTDSARIPTHTQRSTTTYNDTPHNTHPSAAERRESATETSHSTRSVTNRDPDPNFNEFWNAYPRRVDKGHAVKVWAAKIAAGVEPQTIIKGAAAYRDSPTRPTESRFIPHPATWLNGDRWADEERVTTAPRPRFAGGGATWNN